MTKVLIIGDAILDHFVMGQINRMSPEDSSAPILDIESESCRLGGCLNVAANIVSLGSSLDVTVSSIFVPFCLEEIKKRGIGFDGLLVPEEFGLIKTRLVDSKRNKQIARMDRNKVFCEKSVKMYKQNSSVLMSKFNQFDYIVVSDYCKGVVDDETIKKMETFGGTVFVDTKKPDLSIWNKISNCFIKINNKEWNEAKQRTRHPVIVTLGSSGAELRNTQDWHDTIRFPAPETIEHPDVVGCGDVFFSGLVVKHIETKKIEESITYANKVAGLAAKQQGTVEVKL